MSGTDKRAVRAAFEHSAAHYDEVAVLQREVATRLLERLDLFKLQPHSILDIGCGTGHCTYALAAHYPKARIVAMDLAHAMVKHTRKRFSFIQRKWRNHGFTCADAERLPFATHSFEMIFSNLTLQWCSDLEGVFSEFRRVLKPGGLVLFSTLGPDTLKELRSAWAAVDGHVHVNKFTDMHDVGDAMVRARLADPVMDMEMLTLTYREGMTLMRDLQRLGAHNVNAGRNPGLTGRARIQAVLNAYEKFRTADGLLPASYEVLYGHAWRAEQEREVIASGDAVIRVDQIGGRRHG
ncbi:MAG TPA: malonyl-ACP O-methyltransferase BioC [Gammaproteobacteria bacterium]